MKLTLFAQHLEAAAMGDNSVRIAELKHSIEQATKKLIDLEREAAKKKAPRLKPTPRELEILELICSGFTSQEIARILRIAHKTVCTHRYNAMKRIGARNTVEVLRYMVAHHHVTYGTSMPDEKK